MSFGNFFNKVKEQASVAGAQASQMFQVGRFCCSKQSIANWGIKRDAGARVVLIASLGHGSVAEESLDTRNVNRSVRDTMSARSGVRVPNQIGALGSGLAPTPALAPPTVSRGRKVY
jgi:hypothetical protein